MTKELKEVILDLIMGSAPVCCCKKVDWDRNGSCMIQKVRDPNECPVIQEGGGSTPSPSCRMPCPLLGSPTTSRMCGFCNYCSRDRRLLSVLSRNQRTCRSLVNRMGGSFRSYTCCAPSSDSC